VGSVLNVDDIAEKISETFKVRLESMFFKLLPSALARGY